MAITFSSGEIIYSGAVLEVFCDEHRAMSDVYTDATFAFVWSALDNAPRKILVNSNFELDHRGGRACVDASPEVLAAYQEYREQRKRDEIARAEFLQAQREKKAVRVGRIMKVVTGRKIKGNTVVVAYIYQGHRALVKDPNCNWQDRTTPGVWLDCKHLVGVE